MPQNTPLLIRFGEFTRLCRLRGWTTDAEIARQLKVSQSTITNLRAGRTGAGPKVIDAVLRVFGGAVYDVLFVRQEEEEVIAQ